MTLHINRTPLGTYYVYARDPREAFATTRKLVPALAAVSVYDLVGEDADELRERFGHLLAPGEGARLEKR
jgi:hypothetical protein